MHWTLSRFGGATLFALHALAASAAPATADGETARLCEELRATRASFEARITALEQRLQQLEGGTAPAPVLSERLDVVENRLDLVESSPPTPPPSASSLNPQISLILGGTWSGLSRDPEQWRLQGLIPAGEEIGPGERSFSLGESELTLSASIDPLFYGQATFAVTGEDEIEVEEAFVRSSALPGGVSAQFGRFYSALGYVNTQHAHAWDFVDAPLVYQAFFGGQYRNEGLQLRWLAPLETFVELGAELGNGHQFPGADGGNGVGSWTLFGSVGGDIGPSSSWKAGLAWLEADATGRGYEEADPTGDEVFNPTEFSGDSRTWSAHAVYKWAPQGNSRYRSLKLQGEYFAREEDGTLSQMNEARGTGLMDYRAQPRGWYVQGIYQFIPNWRVGLRYDRVESGASRLRSTDGVLHPRAFPGLAEYDPERSTLMLDWSPTEFSRLRLQYARDHSSPGGSDEQLYLQYLMSLGAHGAHQF